MQNGLQYDQTRLIAPTPDPIGRHERKVLDESAPQLEQAGAAVDEALEEFTARQQHHQQALNTAQRAGCKGMKDYLVAFHGGPSIGPDPNRMRRPTEAEKAGLVAAEQEARDQYEEAGHQLSRARALLNQLEQQHDRARRHARHRDR